MIESIHFENFKVLRDATLPLGRFTLIVGPNGSGKSTVFQGLQVAQGHAPTFERAISADAVQAPDCAFIVRLRWADPWRGTETTAHQRKGESLSVTHTGLDLQGSRKKEIRPFLSAMRFYSLNAAAIAQNVLLRPQLELGYDGAALAAVLDSLRDRAPERFEQLNLELHRWLPEFDRILFDTPGEGQRAFLLRTATGGHKIPATEISQGTLLALALLTLAYQPQPPSLIGLEEPDRGIHPRLLRDVQDALYRLSYPENYGEQRPAVQVIATTHSPYMLDLYRDHPEEVVLAEKDGLEAHFQRLSDRPDVHEILQDSHLGDAWYSGILGGVPAKP